MSFMTIVEAVAAKRTSSGCRACGSALGGTAPGALSGLPRAQRGDRHQLRFIVSTECGAQYEELKPFTRRLMTAMERDLDKARLGGRSITHNTGHPNTHIIIRGKHDHGRDLVKPMPRV